MAEVKQQIVVLGGAGDTEEQTRALYAHVVGLTGKKRPNILYVPTAVGDSTEGITRFYETQAGLGELSHLRFFPYPPSGLRELVLGQDAICVSGGKNPQTPAGPP